jgi:hypothetical protein
MPPRKSNTPADEKGVAPSVLVSQTANSPANSKPWLFQKGQSGNPSGRPKGATELKRLAQEHTVDAIKKLVSIMNNENAPFADQRGAAEQILNRGWGKPLQQMELGKPGDFAEMSDAEVDDAISMLVAELSDAKAFKHKNAVN